MRADRSIIVNAALTGVVTTRSQSPHIPLSHDEIVEDCARCLELGVQMLHVHVRDEQGKHTADPEPCGRLVEAIRKLPGGREAIVCVTTSGRVDGSFESRSRVLDLDGEMRPDMASLTTSSLNFINAASVNQPEVIRALAARMKERGILPELEVFDLGMANFVHVLLREGLISSPPYVNVLLGNIASAQATLLELGTLLNALPPDAVIGVAGIGRFQLSANLLGLLSVDAVRVGLEDNLWFDVKRSRPASNPALVQRLVQLAEILERPLAARSAVRRRLGLER